MQSMRSFQRSRVPLAAQSVQALVWLTFGGRPLQLNGLWVNLVDVDV